ncbi:glycosyltransferase [Microbacterium sp. HMH0099]|uniref:glycosyltransferase n=1 Tax=Microbacterium sp. HMH0099 TaxID=3414026 RepID=UPI003BF70885
MAWRIPGSGGKAALVCSTGGHLAELLRLEASFGRHPDSLWITFDTPQSRQLLEGRRVAMLPYIGPRDLRGTLAAVGPIHRFLRSEPFDAAISTGAAVATAALPLAASLGIASTYVESVCRVEGPSTTGRLLQNVPAVHLRTQTPAWAGGRWHECQSVLSTYRPTPRRRTGRRLFVTLGTIRGYRFDSLVDALLASGLVDDTTVWQLGETSRDDLPGRVYDEMPPEQFVEEALNADVVISHAGVGTLLEMLSLGVFPVIATRAAARGEHVDDHQAEIAALVNELGIGIAVDGPDVTAAVLDVAATRTIVDDLAAPVRRAA